MKISPTKFARYSVSDTGIVFKDGKELKSHPRGVITKNGTRYQAVNISIYDDNGKFAKQIKYYVHRLVAEAFIENPNNLSEVDHIDQNKENNYLDNLRWVTRQENMSRTGLPAGTIREVMTSKIEGRNPTKYIKKDGEWVLIPSERPPWNKGLKGSAWNALPDGTIKTRIVNGKPGTFIKQNGKWVYQTNNPKPRGKNSKENKPKRKILPDGTITTRSDGTKWIKENGKWVYISRKDHNKYPDDR